MYKTIRHGENSLQYTILPQNDDFRIEGKLSSAESSCSSSTGRKPKTKRPRRRSFFAYLGLIFVCTVIVGAVLIPFLVSAECLPSPTEWFLKTKAALMKSGKVELHNNVNSNSKNHGNLYGNAHNTFVGSGINVGKTVKIINQSGVEKLIIRVNKTNNVTDNAKDVINLKQNIDDNNNNNNETIVDQQKFTAGNAINSQQTERNGIETVQQDQQQQQLQAQIQTQRTVGNTVENEIEKNKVDSQLSISSGLAPTIVTTLHNQFGNDDRTPQEQQQQQLNQFIAQSQTAPNVRPTTFSTSTATAARTSSNTYQAIPLNNGNNIVTPTSTLLTRIIQVPLLKSAAKKPIIPPVLVKTNSQLSTANGIDVPANSNIAGVSPTLLSAPVQTEQQSSFAQAPGQQDVNGNSNVNENSVSVVQPAKATDWIHNHWTYIDPATYFQWNGYKAEDSVLLPALLGFALIGVILIITVCLVARNKRTIVSSVRKRNRNDVEANGAEDNTTLLTTNNLSDED